MSGREHLVRLRHRRPYSGLPDPVHRVRVRVPGRLGGPGTADGPEPGAPAVEEGWCPVSDGVNADECRMDGCEKPVRYIGLCIMHLTRYRRHGDPLAVTHPKDRNLARGEQHHSWTGPNANYKDAHRRVSSKRGPASSQACVDCGATAAHWSYDHSDPDERISDKGRAYSLDAARYQPRCVSCHRKFDLSINPAPRIPIDLEAVRRMHAEGIRVKPMARILGVGDKRVAQIHDELGLPRLRRRSQGAAKPEVRQEGPTA